MADPQLTLAWWDKNRPKTLPSTGFGDNLKAYEKAVKAFEKEVSQPRSTADVDKLFHTASAALSGVAQGARKASGKCNKTLHKDGIALLDTVMKKTIPLESKRIGNLHAVWVKNRDALKAKRKTELKQIYDAREKVVQDLTKLQAASVKESKEINDKFQELVQMHGNVLRYGKSGSISSAANELAKLKKEAAAVLKDGQAWLQRVEPAMKAKWPEVDIKTLADKERAPFNQQADKRSNSLVALNDAHRNVDVAVKWIPKGVKEAEAAAKP